MRDNEYFPKNYNDSRLRFREAATALPQPAVMGAWQIPGGKDGDLFVDHVWLPALEKPRTLVVITSGVHGAESYAGAAIQQMFMREILPQVDRRSTGIFIAHAMNPFGFKNNIRCTENKVNLNRNFSVSGEMFKLKNDESFRLNEKFLPKRPVDSRKSYFLSTLEMRNGQAFFDGISLDQLTKGIAPGQFVRPEHVEYGGKELEPQSLQFIATMREIMPEYQDVIGLDLHTGLGDRGRLHLLAGGGQERVDPTLFNKIFDPKTDAEFYVFTPPEAEGFYEVYGGINAAFVELSTPKQRVCAVTMEYGTLGHSLEKQIEGMNSFFLDHQGQFYGFTNPELAKEIADENFARSYPDDEAWKSAIIKASSETLKRVFARASRSI